MGKSCVGLVRAKSERKKVKVPKIKKDLLLSKTEIKSICSIGLLKWQEKNLQKLTAEKLKEKAWHGFLKELFKFRRMILKQVVQQRQRREKDSRNNCQVGDLHQIIKISGHGIIRILYLCLCGIHPLVCIVIPHLLILVLVMNLYVMEGCKIIFLINDQKPKYLFRLCMLLWMNLYG